MTLSMFFLYEIHLSDWISLDLRSGGGNFDRQLCLYNHVHAKLIACKMSTRQIDLK